MRTYDFEPESKDEESHWMLHGRQISTHAGGIGVTFDAAFNNYYGCAEIRSDRNVDGSERWLVETSFTLIPAMHFYSKILERVLTTIHEKIEFSTKIRADFMKYELIVQQVDEKYSLKHRYPFFAEICQIEIDRLILLNKLGVECIDLFSDDNDEPPSKNKETTNDDTLAVKLTGILNQKQISELAGAMQRVGIINKEVPFTQIGRGFSLLSGYSENTIKDGMSGVASKSIKNKKEVAPIIEALRKTIEVLQKEQDRFPE